VITSLEMQQPISACKLQSNKRAASGEVTWLTIALTLTQLRLCLYAELENM